MEGSRLARARHEWPHEAGAPTQGGRDPVGVQGSMQTSQGDAGEIHSED